MATLILDNLPDDLVESLHEQASLLHRSVEEQALAILRAAFPKPLHYISQAEVDAQCEAWSQLAGRWISDKTVEEELQELYAARGRDLDL